MKVTSGTDSLYYYIPSDNPNVAYLSFKTMSDISPGCAPDKTSLAAIGRLTPAEQQNAASNPNDGNPPGSVKIGSYYYSYSHAQAACYDESSSAAINKAQPDTDISKIFDTLEAVPSQ